MLCFTTPNNIDDCHKVLVGKKNNETPKGWFVGNERLVADPLYGGSVIVFSERTDRDSVYAIHRTWNGIPSERREWRLSSGTSADRKITNGCVNVDSITYSKLQQICNTGCQIRINP